MSFPDGKHTREIPCWLRWLSLTDSTIAAQSVRRTADGIFVLKFAEVSHGVGETSQMVAIPETPTSFKSTIVWGPAPRQQGHTTDPAARSPTQPPVGPPGGAGVLVNIS